MKALVTGLGPISDKIHSHKAAQAVIYADQIKQAGHDVTINLTSNKITDYNDYDQVYFYHGSDWSGGLNLFGGIEAYPNTQYLKALSEFKGKLFSLIIDMPDYAHMFNVRVQKAEDKGTLPDEWRSVNLNQLRFVQEKAITIDPNLIKRYSKLGFGDSHAICMYRPGWENVSVPFSTLHGSIKKGFEYFIPSDGKYDEMETYFGNIDIRHHLCRFENRKEKVIELVERYVNECKRISDIYNCSMRIWEPLPIENESRKLPKTGYYKGTPFFGSWQERNDVRNMFIDELVKRDVDVFHWTENLKNSKGELSFDCMEKPQSVHLSREFYPHWQGKNLTEIKEECVLLDLFMV